MLLLLSPAKKQQFQQVNDTLSQPLFAKETAALVTLLQSQSKDEIKSLMKLSDSLATLNFDRYQGFAQAEQAAAAMAFQGDVYQGLDVRSIDPSHYDYLNQHVGILSGMYGFLRPFDAIKPHRLEMGTKLENAEGANLYAFWQTKVTTHINHCLSQHEQPVLLNAASKEYAGAVDFARLEHPVIHLDFKVDRGDEPKTIGIYAKKARGLMARWMVEHQVKKPEQLQSFCLEQYGFKPTLSNNEHWVFVKTLLS